MKKILSIIVILTSLLLLTSYSFAADHMTLSDLGQILSKQIPSAVSRPQSVSRAKLSAIRPQLQAGTFIWMGEIPDTNITIKYTDWDLKVRARTGMATNLIAEIHLYCDWPGLLCLYIRGSFEGGDLYLDPLYLDAEIFSVNLKTEAIKFVRIIGQGEGSIGDLYAMMIMDGKGNINKALDFQISGKLSGGEPGVIYSMNFVSSVEFWGIW
jgi:hypothetical protein